MTQPKIEVLSAAPDAPRDRIESKAAAAARARLDASYRGQPLIDPPYDPLDPINRAKRGDGVPAPETNPLNPNGTATVNGQEGNDSADTGTAQPAQTKPASALPESLTPQAQASLETAGLTTLALAAAKTDAELKDLPNVGDKAVEIIRAAAKAAGLPVPTTQAQ